MRRATESFMTERSQKGTGCEGENKRVMTERKDRSAGAEDLTSKADDVGEVEGRLGNLKIFQKSRDTAKGALQDSKTAKA